MNLKRKIGNKKVSPFTIPSGIITTKVPGLERIGNKVLEIGILTTKSISFEPREGNREPILAQYASGSFINAVGLSNPGAKQFGSKLADADIPRDKFLLVSIFGGNTEEFMDVVSSLEARAKPKIDGYELNLSCPHVEGHGAAFGKSQELTAKVVRNVKESTEKPLFAKLTPEAENIGQIAAEAVGAGAYGITAINTVGPGYHTVDGQPVLTNKTGGISGRGIKPIGLKCVREIREQIGNKVPIMAMGGISTAKDVKEYDQAGADYFGIGSALAGMTTEDIKKYFSKLSSDLRKGTSTAPSLLKEVDMSYEKVNIQEVSDENCEFKIYKTDRNIGAEPGQFIFAWLPGVGEKPFSVMSNDPLTLGVLSRGQFTEKFNSLEVGDSFYFRGPYGQGLEVPENSKVGLVGGGCGIAGIYLLAKRFSERAEASIFLGAEDKEHLPYIEKFKRQGEVHVATEDGSLGERGMITKVLKERELRDIDYFFNCGSKPMLDEVLKIERKIVDPENIYSSKGYLMTKCGVGLCGSCTDEKGRRPCIEGPFLSHAD